MIIVLLENPANVIIPFMDKLAKSYPQSSRKKVSRGAKASDVVSGVTHPPLFNSGWFIECHPKVAASTIERMDAANPKNMIVIKVSSRKELNAVRESLGDVKFSFVDNYYLDKMDVIDWIEDELHCSYIFADMIYSRTGGKISNLVEAVTTLSALDTLTESDVRNYVPKYEKRYPSDIVQWMLGQEMRYVNLKSIVEIIYDYRYGISWLVNYLLDSLGSYLTVFELVHDGKLSLADFQKQKETLDVKEIREMTDYKLRKMIELFGKVSYEFIFYIHGKLKEINTASPYACQKLLAWVKLGG